MIHLPADVAVFQYYKGLSFGVLVGIALAWLWWRLPVHLRTRRTRKLRLQVLDMYRIESAFKEASGVAKLVLARAARTNARYLRVHRISLRERIIESAQQFWQDTAPRTPEQVAWAAYERELVR